MRITIRNNSGTRNSTNTLIRAEDLKVVAMRATVFVLFGLLIAACDGRLQQRGSPSAALDKITLVHIRFDGGQAIFEIGNH